MMKNQSLLFAVSLALVGGLFLNSSSSGSSEAASARELPTMSRGPASNFKGAESVKSSSALQASLVMKSPAKLPTSFPAAPAVRATPRMNRPTAYSIDYRSSSGQPIALFTGTLYRSTVQARRALEPLLMKNAVPTHRSNQQSLGYGITGYTEGTAGHTHIGWQEGRWTLAIHSASQNAEGNRALARKMVKYLESHALPIPKQAGVISVQYAGANGTSQTIIRWQEATRVYELKTHRPPLDALKMVVSVE